MTSNFQETNPDEEEKARPSTDATDKMFCPEVNPNNGVVDNDVIDGDEGKHITAIPNLPTSSSCSISAAAAAGGNPSLPAAAAAASLPPPAEHDDTDASSMRGNYESWNDMLYQLLLFKARNGDVNVPDNDTRYRPLYDWVQTQREHYTLYQQDETSTALLNADRVAVLESIDIQCTVRGEMLWQTYFDALVAYKNEHDDVRVPRHYEKVPKLSEWVTDQRRQCKLRLEGKPSTMTAERMAKLDQLGFVWQFRDRMDWNERYEKLLEYKKEFGHCIVPQNYLKSNALGKWVAKQREQYCYYQEGKHSFLTDERIDLLNSIGFVWRLKGKGINKNKNAPAMMPKVQSAIQRKIAAKMKEEETKMVELKSAMSIVPSEEDRNLKPPALLLSSTTTSLSGVECNQSEFRRIGIGYGIGGSDAGGAASGAAAAAAAAAMVVNNPKAKQAITYLPMTFHASNGHGGWLC